MKLTYPMLLDGGLSNVLEKQGCDLDHRLWSARILETRPEAIIQAHLAYLKSGAQCLITSSYQATVPGFMALGHDRSTAENYILRSVELAEEARKRFLATGANVTSPLIAASIGPYGAYLADGSEYRGNYGISENDLKNFHLSRIRILDASGADFLACETIPDFQEAKVLAGILKECRKEAWISFSCKDGKHLNDGTRIGECAAFFAEHPTVFAIGVNCTDPSHVSGLISALKEKSGSKKIVVYPNSGEVYHASSKTWMGLADPDAFAAMAKEWLELGAHIIGGCCRIGPEQIRSLAEILNWPEQKNPFLP